MMKLLNPTEAVLPPLDFELPPELEAREPPEARGLRRDGVRLLVSDTGTDRLTHTTFQDLPDFLKAGDLLVVNTSPTLPAALPAVRDGRPIRLHLSTPLTATPPEAGLWTVELRELAGPQTRPLLSAGAGEQLELPQGASARLLASVSATTTGVRLWLAALSLPAPLLTYLERHGQPIRYGYIQGSWPLENYQTVYASGPDAAGPGSAEMPSAGRAFTPELLTRLLAKGVDVAPLSLHCGVSSQEVHEPPGAEPYRVPEDTARRVNAVRAAGGRVIAVGTTVVRALESVLDAQGQVHPGLGSTTLLVTPQRPPRGVDGLLTGWHEPRASHLQLLEALAGRPHLSLAYRAALEAGYLWHEFGDLHLLLKGGQACKSAN